MFQDTIVRTLYGTTDWFRTEKGVRHDSLLSLCLFNLYTEHIMRNAELDGYKQESRQAGETSTTSDMWMIPL